MNEFTIRANVPGAPEDVTTLFLENPEYMTLRVRYIEMNDTEAEHRRSWLNKSLLHYSINDFSTRPDILLSTAKMDYDVIIFGGEDHRRIAEFMKEHSSMMVNKIKICICMKSDPKRRAKLIMLGFDDVIDIGRTHYLEFMARIFSFWKRYQDNAFSRKKDNEFQRSMTKAAHAYNLPPRLRSVLQHLLKSPGNTATYNSLCIAASSDSNPITRENLKVIISNLRKFLRPGYRITSDRQSTYTLIQPK